MSTRLVSEGPARVVRVTRATKPAKTPSKATSTPRPKPAEPKETPAQRLASQPVAVVLELLRAESGALNAGAIKQRLMEFGVDRTTAESAWNRARDRIRFDDHVVVERNTYRFTATARTISPEEALARLTRPSDAARRPQLLAIIQAALEGGTRTPAALAEARNKLTAAEQRIGSLEQEVAKISAEKAAEQAALQAAQEAAQRAAQEAEVARSVAPAPAPAPAPVSEDPAHAQYERAERRRAARERQARIDAMAAVAELAAEVEELTAKRAAPDVLLEHTRALTGGSGLEAIGRAGESTPYDETRHDPVGDFPNEGDAVIVIRPGYLWHAPGEAVLISKALVTRA